MQLINRKSLRLLTCQLLALLMAQEEEHAATGVSVAELSDRYLAAHGVTLNPCEYGFLSLSELLKSLPYLVEVCLSVCLSMSVCLSVCLSGLQCPGQKKKLDL